MAALHESLELFLATHHDKNYCADCLAQATGKTGLILRYTGK